MTFGISTKASPMRFLSYRMKDFSWRYCRHLLVCTDCFVVVDGSFALIECTGPSFVLTGLSPCLGIASFLNTRHNIRIWQGRKGILAWKCLIFGKTGISIRIKTTFDFFDRKTGLREKTCSTKLCRVPNSNYCPPCVDLWLSRLTFIRLSSRFDRSIDISEEIPLVPSRLIDRLLSVGLWSTALELLSERSPSSDFCLCQTPFNGFRKITSLLIERTSIKISQHHMEFFCGFSRHQAGWVAFGDSVTHGGKQIQICNGSQKHF